MSKDTDAEATPEANSLRGVGDMELAREWLQRRNIQDIECIVPELAGGAGGESKAASGNEKVRGA